MSEGGQPRLGMSLRSFIVGEATAVMRDRCGEGDLEVVIMVGVGYTSHDKSLGVLLNGCCYKYYDAVNVR